MAQALRIGLDFDGVIIDHTENKLRLAAERGFELDPWQTNANVMSDYVPKEEYQEIREKVYTDMTLQAPPVEGALEAIEELVGELYIVSARRVGAVRHAQEWLGNHRLYDKIPAERIFFCGDEQEKRQHCHRLGLQLYLDDKLKVLGMLPFGVRRTWFDPHGLVERIQPPREIKVVNGWSEFLDLANMMR